MKWINQLERKYGKYAIHNLTLYVIFGFAVVYILGMLAPELYAMLTFNRTLILQGQVWRVFTFALTGAAGIHPIFIIFVLMFYYNIGNSLERAWGAFKFNIYILIGCILTLILGFVFNMGIHASYVYTSIFLAFATMFPEFTVRIYFVLPVKMKWLGWISGGILIITFLTGGLGVKLMVFAGVLNYVLFFWQAIINFFKRNTTQKARKNQYKQAAAPRPNKRSGAKGQVIKVSFHKCEVCGKTEIDDPEMEFRYCSKCSDSKEYCMDHLFDHEHK